MTIQAPIVVGTPFLNQFIGLVEQAGLSAYTVKPFLGATSLLTLSVQPHQLPTVERLCSHFALIQPR